MGKRDSCSLQSQRRTSFPTSLAAQSSPVHRALYAGVLPPPLLPSFALLGLLVCRSPRQDGSTTTATAHDKSPKWGIKNIHKNTPAAHSYLVRLIQKISLLPRGRQAYD